MYFTRSKHMASFIPFRSVLMFGASLINIIVNIISTLNGSETLNQSWFSVEKNTLPNLGLLKYRLNSPVVISFFIFSQQNLPLIFKRLRVILQAYRFGVCGGAGCITHNR